MYPGTVSGVTVLKQLTINTLYHCCKKAKFPYLNRYTAQLNNEHVKRGKKMLVERVYPLDCTERHANTASCTENFKA